MASDLYLSELILHPGDDWYVGLEVTYECVVGCWNGSCANCYAGLNIGMASATSCDCGSIPDNFKYFSSKDISVSCGTTRTFTFTHTVTQTDIDRINAGTVRRACAVLSQGRSGMCYEHDSLNVVEIADGQITKYEYPSEASPGAGINIFADVKNVGQGSGSFYLDLVDGPEVIHRDTIGTLAAGASAYNRHLTGIMPNNSWNLAIELWRV